MDPNKTRIWRGGLTELVNPGDPAEAQGGSDSDPRSLPTQVEAPRFAQPRPVLQPSRSEPSVPTLFENPFAGPKSEPRRSQPPPRAASTRIEYPPPPAKPGSGPGRRSEPPPRSVPVLFENGIADSKPNTLVATCILPIERLLPGMSAEWSGDGDASGSDAASATPSADPAKASAGGMARDVTERLAKKPGESKLRRYGGHVLVGLLTLIAVAVWKLPPLAAGTSVRATPLADPAVQREDPALQPSAAESAAPSAASPEAVAAQAGPAAPASDVAPNDGPRPQVLAMDALPTPTAEAEGQQGTASGSEAQANVPEPEPTRIEPLQARVQNIEPDMARRPSSRDPAAVRLRLMERAAVDALVAGDVATAQRLYSQLASANPSAEAFQLAARILSHR